MVEDKGRGVSPQWRASSPKDPTLLPVQRSVLFSRLFFSLVKKMLAHREGELWEERVGYSFDEVSLSSCMILNCLSAKKKTKTKKDPEPHFSCLYPNCSQTSSVSAAWSVVLTLNYAKA